MVLLVISTIPAIAAEDAPAKVYEAPLEVCADPNNLPYSNKAGEGFENKLAELIAADWDTSVSYFWFPQRRGFVRETLQAGNCDVIMGIPPVDGIESTRRYYQSGYVFVSRADRNILVDSMLSPALRRLRIGVSLVGDDEANTPPAQALAQQGIVENVVGFPLGNYAGASPGNSILDAVVEGRIDVAAVWGPLAGYYRRTSSVPLRVRTIRDTREFYPFTFRYSIGMGVRPGDEELRKRLSSFIATHQQEIGALLEDYGVPLFEGDDE
ncbi:quinoprotein dehydrogenase-associated putative ABC transporter substrate-binding protein [Devosia sp. D6-9]|nr:quinoprotein dehydrogenase-associated putative ABC transporter substrate-binding protein [Devosia sp. D6-9]